MSSRWAVELLPRILFCFGIISLWVAPAPDFVPRLEVSIPSLSRALKNSSTWSFRSGSTISEGKLRSCSLGPGKSLPIKRILNYQQRSVMLVSLLRTNS